MRNNTKAPSLARKGRLTDAKLLLIITICVFVVMYLCAVLFLGSGFKKPQTFFNMQFSRSRTSPFPSALPCSKRKTSLARSSRRGSMRSGASARPFDAHR